MGDVTIVISAPTVSGEPTAIVSATPSTTGVSDFPTVGDSTVSAPTVVSTTEEVVNAPTVSDPTMNTWRPSFDKEEEDLFESGVATISSAFLLVVVMMLLF